MWLNKLADLDAANAILLRLVRIENGNLGVFRSLQGGLYEFKIDVGPGYRIYFAKVGSTILVILCAGSKSSQSRDIEKAKRYLANYKSGLYERKKRNISKKAI